MNQFWDMQGVTLPRSAILIAYDDINGRSLWKVFTLNQFRAMQGIILPYFKF